MPGRDFDEHEHPRWPRGTPIEGDAGGGRFRGGQPPSVGEVWAHTLASRLPGGSSPREQYHAHMLQLGRRQVRENVADGLEDGQLADLVDHASTATTSGQTDPNAGDHEIDALRHHLTSHYPQLSPEIPMRNTAPETPGETPGDGFEQMDDTDLRDLAIEYDVPAVRRHGIPPSVGSSGWPAFRAEAVGQLRRADATPRAPDRRGEPVGAGTGEQTAPAEQLMRDFAGGGRFEIHDRAGGWVTPDMVERDGDDIRFDLPGDDDEPIFMGSYDAMAWRPAAPHPADDLIAGIRADRAASRRRRGGADEAGTAQELVAAVNRGDRVTVWEESQQEWLEVERAEMHGQSAYGGSALITLRFSDGGGTISLPAIPRDEMMEWRVGTTPGRTDLGEPASFQSAAQLATMVQNGEEIQIYLPSHNMGAPAGWHAVAGYVRASTGPGSMVQFETGAGFNPEFAASEQVGFRRPTPGRTDLDPGYQPRGLYGTRDENDQWNNRVVGRVRELMLEVERNGDNDDEGYHRLADLMSTYNDANEGRHHDMESVDSAVDDLFNELADWDLADEILHDAGLEEPPNRPDYDRGGGGSLPQRSRLDPDVEYPDPVNSGELPFNTRLFGEMMRRAWEASGRSGYILSPDTGGSAERAIGAHIRAMVNLDDTSRSGLSIVIDRIAIDSHGEFSIQGSVLDRDGQRMSFVTPDGYSTVASFKLTFATDGEGRSCISQDLLHLPPAAQGNGLAARWAAQLQKAYRDNEMDYVTVHADIDVGGYAWAKAGFDFRDEYTHKSFLTRLQSALGTLSGDPTVEWVYMQRRGGTSERLQMTPETRREVESLLERSNRGEHITPLEIALLGWAQRDRDGFQGWTTPDGSTVDMWLGKDFMLGTDWYGKAKLRD